MCNLQLRDVKAHINLVALVNPWCACTGGVITVLTVCVCVCVCVASIAQEQSLYDKLSIAADFSLRFQDFQLTELSEVVSFTSYRPFRTFFEVATIFFLHDELPRARHVHAQA